MNQADHFREAEIALGAESRVPLPSVAGDDRLDVRLPRATLRTWGWAAWVFIPSRIRCGSPTATSSAPTPAQVPRRIVPRLEEEFPLPRLCHAAERRSPADLRPGVHQLPYRGLEPIGVLSLSDRILEREGDAQADQRRLRGLSRPRPVARQGGERGHEGREARGPQAGSDHQGRIGRSELAEAELLVVPRPGQQPGVQVRLYWPFVKHYEHE